jgi:2,3-bisphosphoglycerate-dependent phosphoglycerate mutase
MQGHLDSPLTAQGEEQAQAVGDALKHEKFTALYCSDLGRAQQTARYIRSDIELALDKRLRERNLGIFQGLTSEEAQERHPDEFLQFRSRTPDHVVPNGESRRELQRRTVNALGDIGRAHLGQSVVVVSHGGVLDVIYRHARALALDAPREHELHNASLNYLTWSHQGLVIENWGVTAHLPAHSLDEA